MQVLALDKIWYCKVWLLDESKKVIPNLKPNVVALVAADDMCAQVWPKPTKARAKAKSFQRHPGWDLLVELDEAHAQPLHDGDDAELEMGDMSDVQDEGDDEPLPLDAELEDMILQHEVEEAWASTRAERKEKKHTKRVAPLPGEPGPSEPIPGDDVASLTLPRNTRGPDMAVRGLAAGTVTFRTGILAYYKSTQNFQAKCTIHQRCVLTRVGQSCKRFALNSGKGRPIGFMSAWLKNADKYASKEEHLCLVALAALDKASRDEGRSAVQAEPDGFVLEGFERALAEGEAVEPESVNGLI
eukprot:6491847-Amphidinium_carterae.3